MTEENRCAVLEKELAEARIRLARSEAELSTISAILLTAMEQAPVGFVVLDVPAMTVRLVSLTGLGIIGKNGAPTRDVSVEDYFKDWQLLHPDGAPFETRDRPIEQAIHQGITSTNVDAIIRGRDGVERAVMVNAAPVRNEAGEIIGGVVIFNDVTALKALEAERAQTLSFFAHDMKSPLFGAASFLERLLAGKAGHLEPKQGEYLRITRDLIKKVISLTVDFLDVASLGKPGVHLPTEPIEMEPMLAGIEEEFHERAGKKGLSLAFHVEPPLPRVTADGRRIARLLTNLLDNAIKFGGRGTVELRACSSAQGRELKVEILDQGPGLSQKDLVSLFTPFYRGEAGKGVEGSGLGLAAVKAIVEAHGGTIVAENRPEGGACFRITLPADAGDGA